MGGFEFRQGRLKALPHGLAVLVVVHLGILDDLGDGDRHLVSRFFWGASCSKRTRGHKATIIY